jgi:hypothetical protein
MITVFSGVTASKQKKHTDNLRLVALKYFSKVGVFNHKIPPEIPPDLRYFQNCVYQSSSHLPK